MCGRYALTADADELVEAFGVPLPDFDVVPRYNITPGQQALVVAEDKRGRRMGLLTWGLVPGWQDTPGRPLINARCESVLSRPSFSEAVARRRCLVPADGFYEWKREGASKLPFWIHPTEGGVLSFAGIWERWSRPGSEPRHTYAILTMPPSVEVAAIHDRMPVVVGDADRDAWLDRHNDGRAALSLLRPHKAPDYTCRPVSTRVNRPQEDDAGLMEAVTR
ncbi:MAG: SOS response-associated peptidase [Gemmatimonadota bacterium]|nr:SOS response-associated peptidase [Gemmatimonadota bacterium]MDH3422063.1 SOS response-associated peptidase [Gemmatimonadota bacterium]